jgi:recombination protein RecT
MTQKPSPAGGSNVPAVSTLTRKEMTEQTVGKVMDHFQALEESGELSLPKDYLFTNALKAAGLHLNMLTDKNGKSVWDVCSMPSIANALMEMVLDGLSVAKQQGYLIIYGDKLNWQPDYRGHILMAKRDANVKEVNANCIYEGDIFKYQVDTTTGRMKLIEHTPDIENQDITKIKGAYAIVLFNDGSASLEVMTIAQIKKAWLQGFGGGNTKAHQNFTDRMCRKTVINRACNNLIGSADDSASMPEDDDQNKPVQNRDEKIKEKGSKKDLNIQDTTFEDVTKTSKDPADEPKKLSDLGADGKKDGPEY